MYIFLSICRYNVACSTGTSVWRILWHIPPSLWVRTAPLTFTFPPSPWTTWASWAWPGCGVWLSLHHHYPPHHQRKTPQAGIVWLCEYFQGLHWYESLEKSWKKKICVMNILSNLWIAPIFGTEEKEVLSAGMVLFGGTYHRETQIWSQMTCCYSQVWCYCDISCSRVCYS
jgi:hypothetical protein